MNPPVNPPFADLHTHTHCSDGSLSPEALVRKAARRGLKVVAVTDHDTIAGVAAAREAAREVGVGFVPGVELSVTIRGKGVHVLALGFDPSHAGLRDHLIGFVEARRDRVRRMVEKLNDLGVTLTLGDVEAEAVPSDGAPRTPEKEGASGREGASAGEEAVKTAAETDGPGHALGRPHVAAALVTAGVVETQDDAFDTYIGYDGPAYAAKPPVPAEDVFALVHDAGGIAVLAHPGHWTPSRRVRRLIDAGLDGVEVVHPSHDDSLETYYRQLARSRGLVATGGSDYHGHHDGDDERFGRMGLSEADWERALGSLTYYDAA